MGTRLRRIEDRQRESLFRGREYARLMMMIVMLAVLYMMIDRARDANTWRWLVSDHEAPLVPNPGPSTQASAKSDSAATTSISDSSEKATAEIAPAPADQPVAAPRGPTDLDEDELGAAEYEFQAVEDKKAITDIEMPAYWRLAGWARNSTSKELEQRARRDILFTHVFEAPADHRGELIRLRLHLVRSLSHDAPENNPLGIKKVYEAWGWTDESRSNPYLVVFTEMPEGMPIGASIQDEVTFYGYFFKLLAYQSHDEKFRAAPMLIGRVVWHPTAAQARKNEAADPWFWPMLALGGGVVVFVMYRFSRLYAAPSRRQPMGELPESKASLGNWLQQPGPEEPPPFPGPALAENGHAFYENGNAHYLGDERNSQHDTEA